MADPLDLAVINNAEWCESFWVLFEATWIHRAAVGSRAPLALDWQEVDTGEYLHCSSTSGASRAVHGSRVVGVSHLLPGSASLQVVWSDLGALAGSVHPGLDLVGYEQGEDLDAPLSNGFEALGRLRVWRA